MHAFSYPHRVAAQAAQAEAWGFDDRFAVVGPEAEVAERLAGLAGLGVERLIVVLGSLDADPGLLAESNAAFAASVLPAR